MSGSATLASCVAPRKFADGEFPSQALLPTAPHHRLSRGFLGLDSPPRARVSATFACPPAWTMAKAL